MAADVFEVKDGQQVIAVVIPAGTPVDRIRFLTPPDYPFQVGLLRHPSGHRIGAHGHTKLRIETDIFQEFLYIQSGRVRIDLYGLADRLLTSVELTANDAILFVEGAHGLTMLEPTRILEVKQGPYPGDKLAKKHLPAGAQR
jgi:hypothetical protein